MENKQDFVIKKGVLTKYNGPGGDVTIPEGVKKIGARVFYSCKSLKSVTIPEGVTEIGGFAFRGCTEMREVTVPESVKTIGRYAFGDCVSLRNLTIPGRVEEIDKFAFRGCLWDLVLTVPNFPVSYSTIGDDDTLRFLFETGSVKPADIEWMVQMASVVDRSGETQEKIMEYKARYLDSGALVKKAAQPRKTAAPRQKTPINNNPDFDISKGVLTEYKGPGGDVVIPEGVKEIASQAFTGCKGLASVTIPESVTKISCGAFSSCTGLQSVTIPADVKEIGMNAFKGCGQLTIHAPAGRYAEAYAKKKIKFGAI